MSINYMQIVKCECGESNCNIAGRCIMCGKIRMLPQKLQEKIKIVEDALNDCKQAMIDWMNETEIR